MGAMSGGIDNGTPSKHCGNPEPHEKHAVTENWVTGEYLPDERSYCDGVPPLELFVELTVRVPMVALFGNDPTTQDKVLGLLHDEGLGILIDEVTESDTRCALRVRSGDGKDKVYPLLAGKRWPGFKVAVQGDQGQQ